jgi:hypothetical protein
MTQKYCKIIKDIKTNEIYGIFTDFEECSKTYNNILKKNFKDIIKCIENKINNSILNNEDPELNLVYNLKSLKFTFKQNEESNDWTVIKPIVNGLTIDRFSIYAYTLNTICN